MQVINETPLPSAAVPSSFEDDQLSILALTAMTLDLKRSGHRLAAEQLGLMLGEEKPNMNDAQFMRACAGVCATGYVYPSKPGGSTGVATLDVGGARFGVAAFGVRVWEKSAMGSVRPTDPRPFERVEMTWSNAYGGDFVQPAQLCEEDGEPIIVPEFVSHYAANPQGRGYSGRDDDAIGKPVPQLEHPDQLLKTVRDRPEPACFAPYPLFGSLRAQHLMVDGKVDFNRVPHIFARSAPRTTFPKLLPGTRITLAGMRADGTTLTLDVPEAPVQYDVRVGAIAKTLVPYVDSVEIDAERAVARVLYRAGFTYSLIAEEHRDMRVVARKEFPRA